VSTLAHKKGSRVSQFAILLAKEVGFSRDESTRMAIGGFLHDLGKVGIPDLILRKKDKLDEGEFETMKTHPTIGGKLIEQHPLAVLVSDVILHHHERLDGQGYPLGVDGDKITPASRLMAVADAFEAMTSTRPYRAGLAIGSALSRLEAESGSHFDAQMVHGMRELDRKGELGHVVSHSEDGIPLIPCPTCGAVITITRHTHDGDIVYCHICTGEHLLHAHGETFDAEFTGKLGKPEDVQPQANLDVIQDFVAQTPKNIKV
jgi:HD-GYP domain-containing protein (c-di-GMP phosphodiesterase class II)